MAVTRLKYIFPQNGTYYIDLAAGLSLQERRLIRSKQIFTVHGGIYEDVDGSRIEINTAFNNWYTRRAINRAFKMWRKSISTTLQASEGMQSGKWSDFKLYLNSAMQNPDHTVSGSSNSLSPLDSASRPIYNGSELPEWNYATIVRNSLIDPDSDGGMEIDANPDNFDLMIVGTHTGSSSTNLTRVGVVKSWFDSRPMPDSTGDPVLPTNDDPLSNLFNIDIEMDERMDLVDTENDTAPYSESVATGALSDASQSNLQTQAVARTTGANACVSINGFQAICGLMQVVVSTASGSGSESELIIDVDHGVGF